MIRRQSITLQALLLLLFLLVAAAAVSQHRNVQLVPVHAFGSAFPLFPGGGDGATTSLVKVVQSGRRYGNAGQGYYGYGSTGGYIYYDQLPSYGKNSGYGSTADNYGYSSSNGYGNNYGNSNGYGSSNSYGYGGKGYIYYDQLPSYNKGYEKSGYDYGRNSNGYYSREHGSGYSYDGSSPYSNDYYHNDYGYYGNDGYYGNGGARGCGEDKHRPCHSRHSEGARRYDNDHGY